MTIVVSPTGAQAVRDLAGQHLARSVSYSDPPSPTGAVIAAVDSFVDGDRAMLNARGFLVFAGTQSAATVSAAIATHLAYAGVTTSDTPYAARQKVYAYHAAAGNPYTWLDPDA